MRGDMARTLLVSPKKPLLTVRMLTSSWNQPSDLCILLARDHDFDVVLIDTAGRMQDNEVGLLVDAPIDILLTTVAIS